MIAFETVFDSLVLDMSADSYLSSLTSSLKHQVLSGEVEEALKRFHEAYTNLLLWKVLVGAVDDNETTKYHDDLLDPRTERYFLITYAKALLRAKNVDRQLLADVTRDVQIIQNHNLEDLQAELSSPL